MAALLAAGGIAYAQYARSDDGSGRSSPSGSEQDSQGGTTAAAGPPADEACTDALKKNRRWVCLTSAVIEDGEFTLRYDVAWAGSTPDVDNGFHLHIWGTEGKAGEEKVMGAQVSSDQRGKYYETARRPSVLGLGEDRFKRAVGDAPKVCARIAQADHRLVPDAGQGFRTGNCLPIVRK